MKNKYSLVRTRKANKSCIICAADPLADWGSYSLFRSSSHCDVNTGVICIGLPPLCTI